MLDLEGCGKPLHEDHNDDGGDDDGGGDGDGVVSLMADLWDASVKPQPSADGVTKPAVNAAGAGRVTQASVCWMRGRAADVCSREQREYY